MIDPLAEIVTLLQPAARFSKVVVGAGRWRVHREEVGQPFYCVVIDGSCRLTVDDDAPITLHAGAFVLIPAAQNFTMTSQEPLAPEDVDSPPMPLPDGEFRLGIPAGPPDVRLLVGHCSFVSPDAALLVSLLPRLVHVRDDNRLAAVVQLVADESRARRPARDVILSRLLEVLFIEALRSGAGTAASPGLLHGLADARLAEAIRQMHENPARPWTVAQLAKAAALSRSAFFERFSRTVGIAPMAYLLAWRMALAKQLLRRREGALTEVAERVGYSSASTFSVAFARHVGQSPMRYARTQELKGT
jgi:AraC-like DNA-binding protein/mannose-6-phosphate isomerase-like protein (cupin superfamily)